MATRTSSYIMYYNLNPDLPKLEMLPYRVSTDIGVLGGYNLCVDGNRKISNLPEKRFIPLGGTVDTCVSVKELMYADNNSYVALTYNGSLYCIGKNELWSPQNFSNFTRYFPLNDVKYSRIHMFISYDTKGLLITENNQVHIWSRYNCAHDEKLTNHLRNISIARITYTGRFLFLTESGEAYEYDERNSCDWKKKNWNNVVDFYATHYGYILLTKDHKIFRDNGREIKEVERSMLSNERLTHMYYHENMFVSRSERELTVYKRFSMFEWANNNDEVLNAFKIDISNKRIANVTFGHGKVFIMCLLDFSIKYQDNRLSDVDIIVE